MAFQPGRSRVSTLEKEIAFLSKYQSPPITEKFGPPTPFEVYKTAATAVLGSKPPLDEFAFRRIDPADQNETIRFYLFQVTEREKHQLKIQEEFKRVAREAHAAVAARELQEQQEYGLKERLGAW